MKHFLFYTFSVLIFLSSCTESEPEENTEVPRHPSVSGFVGETFYVSTVYDANNCVLVPADPQIAQAEFVNGDICVDMLSAGNTSISLLNSEDKLLMEIFVYASFLNSNTIEERSVHSTYRSEISVEASDKAVKKIIEDELHEDLGLRIRTLYTFNWETKEFTMNLWQSEQSYKGTYMWSIDSLSLAYNGITEKYGFEVAPNRQYYILRADKTKEYQHLYPDAGITNVHFSRILYDLCMSVIVGGLE